MSLRSRCRTFVGLSPRVRFFESADFDRAAPLPRAPPPLPLPPVLPRDAASPYAPLVSAFINHRAAPPPRPVPLDDVVASPSSSSSIPFAVARARVATHRSRGVVIHRSRVVPSLSRASRLVVVPRLAVAVAVAVVVVVVARVRGRRPARASRVARASSVARIARRHESPCVARTTRSSRVGVDESTTARIESRAVRVNESTRIDANRARAPSRRRAYVARSTDRRALASRVVARFARRRARASRAVARAVARCGLLLPFLRLTIRYIQRIMRTRSTITTWITRVIVHVTLCVHTRMSEFSTDDASRRIHRSVGTGRRARQSRCERCGAFERDSRRFATRARSRGVHGNADRRTATARRSR